jgi:hypothetical protein
MLSCAQVSSVLLCCKFKNHVYTISMLCVCSGKEKNQKNNARLFSINKTSNANNDDDDDNVGYLMGENTSNRVQMIELIHIFYASMCYAK